VTPADPHRVTSLERLLEVYPTPPAASSLAKESRTVLDGHTLAIPDRRGNNRLDTVRNLVVDPRVGLLFLVPGLREELRVRGTAVLTTDPEELAQHEVRGVLPASVLLVAAERVYFQCARAVRRSRLWQDDGHVDPTTMPTAGRMTREAGGFSDEAKVAAYDAALAARQEATLYRRRAVVSAAPDVRARLAGGLLT
jgi:PPOX class probable FMN-dependent enzyme